MSEKNYRKYYNELYEIQNQVFAILEGYNFYLTGGTALSRFYLNHRYSDDLDFFTNEKIDFQKTIKEIKSKFDKKFITEVKSLYQDFAQMFIYDDEFLKKYEKHFLGKLKIDFVYDIPARIGPLNDFKLFSRVDNPENMLVNKITAISRQAEKDVVDMVFICKILNFDWEDIINKVRQKDASEELYLVELLRTFPVKEIKKIKWIEEIKEDDFSKDLETIIKDIIIKGRNSLYKK